VIKAELRLPAESYIIASIIQGSIDHPTGCRATDRQSTLLLMTMDFQEPAATFMPVCTGVQECIGGKAQFPASHTCNARNAEFYASNVRSKTCL